MKKLAILTRLKQAGVVAVVRAASSDEAVQISHSLVEGGVTGLELTFTIPQVTEAISELAAIYAEDETVVVGAGSVLDAITARQAIMAGAEYVVSPYFDRETAEICNLYQIPYLPGCMTITEITEALKSGVDVVKLFPSSVYGPEIIKAFKAPLPHVNIMPTGGVNLDNMKEWFDAGAEVVGVGGNLVSPDENGSVAHIKDTAARYAKQYAKIKGGTCYGEDRYVGRDNASTVYSTGNENLSK